MRRSVPCCVVAGCVVIIKQIMLSEYPHSTKIPQYINNSSLFCCFPPNRHNLQQNKKRKLKVVIKYNYEVEEKAEFYDNLQEQDMSCFGYLNTYIQEISYFFTDVELKLRLVGQMQTMYEPRRNCANAKPLFDSFTKDLP